ncbi:MAG: DUF4091 domain-containing protein, partial [Myxococcales bacterium]|nr:DUF4091 domain-containing protein [Myxococcales bacterium]
DQGIAMPIASIRLKNWRRGLQDVEYLALIRKKGHGKFVDKFVHTMVPRALHDEIKHEDLPVAWPDDGEKWLAARRTLAEVLKTNKLPSAEQQQQLGKKAEGQMAKLKRWVRRVKRKWWRGKRRLVVIGAAGAVFVVPIGLIILIRRIRRRRRKKGDYEYSYDYDE